MLNNVNILSEIKTEAGGLLCYYLKKEVYENYIESYKLPDKYPLCGVRYDFHDVRFVFTPSYLSLIYVIFVCLRIVMSGTCRVVFFFVLCTLRCQFLGIVYFFAPSVFSMVYYKYQNNTKPPETMSGLNRKMPRYS
jgi:hypothetical protein